jgi:proteasome lid subunit RPN8/RPN11
MIVISASILSRIAVLAEAAYPEESCGLIVGRRDDNDDVLATDIVPGTNVAVDRRRRFEIDPKLRFDVMRALSAGPERVVGHFHSHPDRPAFPSPADLEDAFEPDLIWVITSVVDGHAIATRAYRLGTVPAFDEVAIASTSAMAPTAI